MGFRGSKGTNYRKVTLMDTYNFLASPPWDVDVDVLFTLHAIDEGQAYSMFVNKYKAMYAVMPTAWHLLERAA